MKEFKWIGFLLLAGGLIFWAGALCPPYKQWATQDTREYLTIINRFRINWYIIHGLFLPGILISLFGVQLLSSSLLDLQVNYIFMSMGSTAFLLGTIFFILNIAFRLTVTVWAANELATAGNLAEWFQTSMDLANLVFALYMILSYFGIGCIGYSIKRITLLPSWISWFCIVFGFSGSILYFFRFPLFAPPLMVYLPLILTGMVIILQVRKK